MTYNLRQTSFFFRKTYNLRRLVLKKVLVPIQGVPKETSFWCFDQNFVETNGVLF